MSFRSWITGAPKITADIFDKNDGHLAKMGGFFGGLVFTEQERAQMGSDTMKDVRAFNVATMGESTDRSKTRRTIAELVIRFYVLELFMASIIFPFNSEWSLFILKIASGLTLGGLVVSTSVFFFGSHALARHNETKERK